MNVELELIKNDIKAAKQRLQAFSLWEGGISTDYVAGLFLGIEAYIEREWPDDCVQGQNVLQQPTLYVPTGEKDHPRSRSCG